MRPRTRARAVAIALLFACACALSSSRASGWLERLTLERDTAALSSTDRAARRAAAERLGRQGAGEPAVDALIAALERETDPEVRAAIVDALARHRDPRALEMLTRDVQGLRDAERDARARALGAIDHPQARRALAAMLGGPATEIAEARLVELGPSVIPDLVPLLEVPASAARAASTLGRLGDPSAAGALIAHASAEDRATRAAVLEALGRAGDERALPVLIAAVAEPEPTIAIAALRALGALGPREAGSALEAALAREEPGIFEAALAALATVDATRAVPALERALSGPHAEAAWRAMLATPDAAFVALFTREAERPARRGEAADALGRVASGSGIGPLTALAERHPEVGAALAVALRRWPAVDGGARERALAALARESDEERRAWLRAIARDERASDALLQQLLGAEPARRATAARALALLGQRDDAIRDAITRALATEIDPVALEVTSGAAIALGARAAAPPLEWLDDPERAVAALRLLSIAAEPPTHREARARSRAIRAALASSAARIRASAVHALATLGARRAAIAIAARLEDEAPEVRRAAASALARLSTSSDPRIAARLASRLGIEPDAEVRSALRSALTGAPLPGGEACLHVRLTRAERVEVELVLPDGSWLRDRTLPTGELVLCDLSPGAVVDVRPAP